MVAEVLEQFLVFGKPLRQPGAILRSQVLQGVAGTLSVVFHLAHKPNPTGRYPWTFLDEARRPSLIVGGVWMLAGEGSARAIALWRSVENTTTKRYRVTEGVLSDGSAGDLRAATV
jgi:hypothetical protein